MTQMVVSPNDDLELIEELAEHSGWQSERPDENEVMLTVPGRGAEFSVAVTLLETVERMEGLHFACAFDLKIPQERHEEARRLACLLNERSWVGHFDVWQDSGLVMLRHAFTARSEQRTVEQCGLIVGYMVEACERFMPAFVLLIQESATAEQAIDFVRQDSDEGTA